MDFTTLVTIPSPKVKLLPQDKLLFVGSCFADNIGKRFVDNGFNAVVNPFGVMYNPVSVKHTLDKLYADKDNLDSIPTIALFTLGTNHVYREISTGEIVDNCQKRPQKLFQEEVMSVEDCTRILEEIVNHPFLSNCKQIIFTVSPIRYKKYGYHESQLSKATLLLAIQNLLGEELPNSALCNQHSALNYFPAYEIVLDELRDYRFYAPDMIHPSEQAVDYIFEHFRKIYFSESARLFYEEYQPIKQALNHKPFNPDSDEYKVFFENAKRKLNDFNAKWRINTNVNSNV